MTDFYTILDKEKGLITVACRSQPVGLGALQRLLDRLRGRPVPAEELSPKEVEAQEAFTQMRDEILHLSGNGLEVNEVLRIIDDHTPEWV
jgi:hypothetical protein